VHELRALTFRKRAVMLSVKSASENLRRNRQLLFCRISCCCFPINDIENRVRHIWCGYRCEDFVLEMHSFRDCRTPGVVCTEHDMHFDRHFIASCSFSPVPRFSVFNALCASIRLLADDRVR